MSIKLLTNLEHKKLNNSYCTNIKNENFFNKNKYIWKYDWNDCNCSTQPYSNTLLY